MTIVRIPRTRQQSHAKETPQDGCGSYEYPLEFTETSWLDAPEQEHDQDKIYQRDEKGPLPELVRCELGVWR